MSESLKTAPPMPWGIIATALLALLPTFSALGWLFGIALTGLVPRLGELSSVKAAPVVTMVWTVMQVLGLALTARARGWQAADYLGWVVPKPRDAAVMLAVAVTLILAFDALDYLLDRDLEPSWQINTYRSARGAGAGWLVMLWIEWIVAAPLGEEIVFRGFLYRGWARSPRAVVPAVAVISALWASLHVKYDWFSILEIFLLGLVLGWARWRSGSTMLTFAMHAFNNAWSTVETHWLT
jgi:membrane protease YdiL (CAAX protease family)